MSLTVLQVGYPLARIGRDAVGGAEQVVSMLDEAVTAAGYRSIVIAPRGSSVAGELVATEPPAAPFGEAERRAAAARHAPAVSGAIARFAPDVVHLHGVDFLDYLPAPGVPAVVTLHLPPSWYPPQVFRIERPGTFLVPVSAAQRRRCPPTAIVLREIPNGVRLDDRPVRTRKKRYALVLGRVCPEKGIHLAIDAAARAGIVIAVAGHVFPYPEHQAYWKSEIEPRLSRSARFIGVLGPRAKRRLISSAQCLVVPSLAEETSCLVAMEALAEGTPVVAFRRGALQEIVEHGRTGFLVDPDDLDGLARAIESSAGLDAEACGRAARERLDARVMTRRYLDLYTRLSCARPFVETTRS